MSVRAKEQLMEDHAIKTHLGASNGGLSLRNPGLKVRLVQGLVEMVMDNMLKYTNAFLNYDLKWPK